MTEGKPERALAGLGAFSRKLAIGTVLAIAIAWAGWRAFMAGEGPSATSTVRPEPFDSGRAAASAQDRLRAAESKGPTTTATAPVRPEPFDSGRAAASAQDRLRPAASKAEGAPSPLSAAIERRHAEGALQEAVKRFPSCPGGDVRRTAWIDGESVVKLAREKADGTQIEEWFDQGGHLREATVRGRAGATQFTRRVSFDERGGTLADAMEPAGVVPDAPQPTLQREDPSAAFFGGPGCVR